ncbi:MAG: hypothetical protein WD009_00095 [Phycisphaeraceae bacterium]
MRRIHARHPYAALTALSLTICLGAAIDAPVVHAARAQAGQVRLSAADRDALASLLSCLTEASKGRTDQHVKQAPAMTPRGPVTAAAELPAPGVRSHGLDGAGRRLPAVVAHRPDLLNLPPPHHG